MNIKVTDDNYYLQLDGRKEYYLVSNERKEKVRMRKKETDSLSAITKHLKVRNEKGTLPEESEL